MLQIFFKGVTKPLNCTITKPWLGKSTVQRQAGKVVWNVSFKDLNTV